MLEKNCGNSDEGVTKPSGVQAARQARLPGRGHGTGLERRNRDLPGGEAERVMSVETERARKPPVGSGAPLALPVFTMPALTRGGRLYACD